MKTSQFIPCILIASMVVASPCLAIEIDIDDVSANEDVATPKVEFTVSLSGIHSTEVSVDWTTQDGSATAPGDYTTKSGTVTIGAGDLSATIEVTVINDDDGELEESFQVVLSNPIEATIGDGVGVATIGESDIEELVWDDGTVDSGSLPTIGSGTPMGRRYFKIESQAATSGGWRSALAVTAGNADLYASRSQLPIPESAEWSSSKVGSDGWVMRPDQFVAGETWYFLVDITTPTADWILYTGDVFVQDLGTLAFVDTNGNGVYDSGEGVPPSSSSPVEVGPEGMRFFRARTPPGVPAWSLWLSGDERDLAVRKSTIPFHLPTQRDHSEAGAMLLVPDYLAGDTDYFFSVLGKPGDSVDLSSTIQPIADLDFGSPLSGVGVNAAPFRVYRVQVPIDQIGWDVSITPTSGDPNVAVRRDRVPSQWFNDAFSELGEEGAADSVTLVPPFLTNATWYITVYGASSYEFDLSNGSPEVTPIDYDPGSSTNTDAERVGWRFFSVSDIPAQTTSLGWGLALSGQVPGTEIAIRRNAVPSRWNSRNEFGGAPLIGAGYLDQSSTTGLLQQPGHQADIWYVGVYQPAAMLGGFTLDSAAIRPPLVDFNAGSGPVAAQAPQSWRYFKVDVPAGPLGWDLRLTGVAAGRPLMVVARDILPTVVASVPGGGPNNITEWPSGTSWTQYADWTERHLDSDGTDVRHRRFVAGMGRSLVPGTYYVGVLNVHATEAAEYTLESYGIGLGGSWSVQVNDLDFATGSAPFSGLAPREAAHYRVYVPPNTPSWEITLEPDSEAEELMMMVRRGAIAAPTIGGFGETQNEGSPQQVRVKKKGGERYVVLPPDPDNQPYLVPGFYYLTVISEGQNPAQYYQTGTDTCAGTVTSHGPLEITDLGDIDATGVGMAVSVPSGGMIGYQFTVLEGATTLEVRLENPTGNSQLTLVGGTQLPPGPGSIDPPYLDGNFQPPYGSEGGQTSGSASGLPSWRRDNDLITIVNPPAGIYTLAISAGYDSGTETWAELTGNLVVLDKLPTPLNFASALNSNGGTHTDTRMMVDGERITYAVEIPTELDGEPVMGWKVDVSTSEGSTVQRIYRTAGDSSPEESITVHEQTAVIVSPWLTTGTTWYVEVEAQGATEFTIVSSPVALEVDPWIMPADYNLVVGDSGFGLPGDQGIDLAEGDWHFYAVDVPEENGGLLRTELQAISGNPDLYLREGGVPTTTHNTHGSAFSGQPLFDRSLTGTTTEYGNWVPLDGKTQPFLSPGRWTLGVKAAGTSNVRYRLRVSTGAVFDGDPEVGYSVAGGDWIYLRFTIPEDKVPDWGLGFSEQVGNVVMWIRDTVPPGDPDGSAPTGRADWGTDFKNQGPYPSFDAEGFRVLNPPQLRPGHTYFAGFRGTVDSSFTVESTIGTDPVTAPDIDFYTGSFSATLAAGETVFARVRVPMEATRWKHFSTNAPGVEIRIEQGTIPNLTGPVHYTSEGVENHSLNTALTAWPWVPGQDYFVRFTNTTDAPLTVDFTLSGRNAATEDEDTDGLPDAWEIAKFGSALLYGPGDDPDHDRLTNLIEWAFGLEPSDGASLGLPRPAISGGYFVISFTEPDDVSGITYGAVWTQTPGPGSWKPVTDSGTGKHHVFSVSMEDRDRLFMRLSVTAD